jgi:hypothetical protein
MVNMGMALMLCLQQWETVEMGAAINGYEVLWGCPITYHLWLYRFIGGITICVMATVRKEHLQNGGSW